MAVVNCIGKNAFFVLLCFILFTKEGCLATNETVSACHGLVGLQQTSNYMFCAPELEICVLEVRYYEHQPTLECPSSEISSPKPECCVVQTDQCYWKGNVSDATEIHNECNATRQGIGNCLVPARTSRPPPSDTACGNYSSIRSIIYSCENGVCPELVPETTTVTTTPTTATEPLISVPDSTMESESMATTTTGSGVTEEQQQEPDNTGAIIGGSIAGGVALGIIIAFIFVTIKNKRSTKYLQKGSSKAVETGTYEGSFNPVVSRSDEKTHM